MKKKSPRRRRQALASPMPVEPSPIRTYSWTGGSREEGVDRLLDLTSGREDGVTARLFLPPAGARALIAHLQRTLPAGSETLTDRQRMMHFDWVLAQVESAMVAPHPAGTAHHESTRGLFRLFRTVARGLLKE